MDVIKEDKQRVEWKRRMLGQEEKEADDPLWLKNKMHWDLTQWAQVHTDSPKCDNRKCFIYFKKKSNFTRSDDFLCVVGVKNKPPPWTQLQECKTDLQISQA